MASLRSSPIDGRNLARTFPGDPAGRADRAAGRGSPRARDRRLGRLHRPPQCRDRVRDAAARRLGRRRLSGLCPQRGRRRSLRRAGPVATRRSPCPPAGPCPPRTMPGSRRSMPRRPAVETVTRSEAAMYAAGRPPGHGLARDARARSRGRAPRRARPSASSARATSTCPATVAPFDGLCETLVGPLDRVTARAGRGHRHRSPDRRAGRGPLARRRRGRPRPSRRAGRPRRQPRRPRPARGGDRLAAEPLRRRAATSPVRHRRPTVSRGQHPMITVRDTGLVYRNPRPELRSKHTWHPTIVRFDDGEMLVHLRHRRGRRRPRLPDLRDPFDRRRSDAGPPRSASSPTRPAGRRPSRSAST